MGTIFDIAAAEPDAVDVRGTSIEIWPIKAKDIKALFARFPALRAAASRQEDWIVKIIEAGPDVAGAVIAAGMRKPDPQVEQAAADLEIVDQVALLSAIIRATAPKGVPPLLDELGLAIQGRPMAASAGAPRGSSI